MTSLDWVQGPWSVQLVAVNRASYSQLQLENRTFPHWIISYVKDGEVTTGSGGEIHRVRSGDVMLHPPNLPFSECSETNGIHLWMQASVFCSHQLDLLQLYRISPVVTIPDAPRFESTFQKLFDIWEKRELPFRDLKLTACMLQLIEQIMSGWEKSGFPTRSHAYDSSGDRFARLIGQMSLRLQDKFTRMDLASIVRLNANYLDRAFQRSYGLTPMQMFRNMRLTRSRMLLERTDDTLESIAAECGMTDASYLCKQFKKQYGILPGEYRESVRTTQGEDLYAQFHHHSNTRRGEQHV